VLGSHVVSRDCKGFAVDDACPTNAKENGGLGSIAEQLVATQPDVLAHGRAHSPRRGDAQRHEAQIAEVTPPSIVTIAPVT
jgi:hypothetical protein